MKKLTVICMATVLFGMSYAMADNPSNNRYPGDLNSDGAVDYGDLLIFASQWLEDGHRPVVITSFSLDTNPNWTTDGQWQFGMPAGMGGSLHGYADPNQGFTGQNVYGVNLSGDYTAAVGGPYSLTAGPFDCNAYDHIELDFARWLNTDSSNNVRCQFEVSNDGSNWQTIWVNPGDTEIADNQWQPQHFDISGIADNHTRVYVRWSYEILSDSAAAYSGWNIDDITLTGRVTSEELLKTNLGKVRRAIASYKADHNYRLPGATVGVPFSLALLLKTNSDGTISETGKYGPYLQRMPANPFVNSETAARTVTIGSFVLPQGGVGDGSGWYYDALTGNFNANNPGQLSDGTYYSDCTGYPIADIAPNGGDGVVNLLDFAVLAKDWGYDPSAYPALADARSGFEFMRYLVSGISVPGTVSESGRLASLICSMQDKISQQGATCFNLNLVGLQGLLDSVALDEAGRETFSAVLMQIGSDTIEVDVTGRSGETSKTIRGYWTFVGVEDSALNFGIATKAPLSLGPKVDLIGVNIAAESNVYIKSSYQMQALSLVGSSHIAGEVSIENKFGYATVQGTSTIGGSSGADAQNHVHVGVTPIDFPTPVTSIFRPYCTTAINSSSPSSGTYVNARVPAGTNPRFAPNTTFQGVLFIESPNQVSFAGGTTIAGIVVGDGDLDNPSQNNAITFTSTVISNPVASLPNTPEFTAIKELTGTFIVAPGFSVAFGGNIGTVNGVIAASGVTFYGNAGGTVKGSILNYDDKAGHVMSLQGSTGLAFDRSGATENPAGFYPSELSVLTNWFPEYVTGFQLSTAEFFVNQIWEMMAKKTVSTVLTYNNKTYSPPIDSNGVTMSNFADYSETIKVENVSVANLQPPAIGSPLYRVTVTVSRNGNEVTSLSWFRAVY